MSTRDMPAWIMEMALAANHCSLDYDSSVVPDYVWTAFEASLSVEGPSSLVLRYLSECEPIEAHQFFHCIGHYDEHPEAWEVVLNRADCDQATAMMYVAYFWNCVEEPENDRWMEDSTQKLMNLIRNRAWNDPFRTFDLGLPEGCLLELEDMRAVLVANQDHPFSLPASFLPKSKSEAFYYKLRDKIVPRSWSAKTKASGQTN